MTETLTPIDSEESQKNPDFDEFIWSKDFSEDFQICILYTEYIYLYNYVYINILANKHLQLKLF